MINHGDPTSNSSSSSSASVPLAAAAKSPFAASSDTSSPQSSHVLYFADIPVQIFVRDGQLEYLLPAPYKSLADIPAPSREIVTKGLEQLQEQVKRIRWHWLQQQQQSLARASLTKDNLTSNLERKRSLEVAPSISAPPPPPPSSSSSCSVPSSAPRLKQAKYAPATDPPFPTLSLPTNALFPGKRLSTKPAASPIVVNSFPAVSKSPSVLQLRGSTDPTISGKLACRPSFPTSEDSLLLRSRPSDGYNPKPSSFSGASAMSASKMGSIIKADSSVTSAKNDEAWLLLSNPTRRRQELQNRIRSALAEDNRRLLQQRTSSRGELLRELMAWHIWQYPEQDLTLNQLPESTLDIWATKLDSHAKLVRQKCEKLLEKHGNPSLLEKEQMDVDSIQCMRLVLGEEEECSK